MGTNITMQNLILENIKYKLSYRIKLSFAVMSKYFPKLVAIVWALKEMIKSSHRF